MVQTILYFLMLYYLFISIIEKLRIEKFDILMSIVRSERQDKYCINISQHYCNHWEDIQALREALQNWMDAWKTKYLNHKLTVKFQEDKILKIYRFFLVIDGVKNTQNYIEYDQEETTLKMVNEGSFNVQNMLMGSSSKKKNTQALGQFGEGMKLFFMILLKHGYRLYIQSGSYVYAPSLTNWQFEQYESKVLYVNIKPKDFKDQTALVIKNVSKIKFDEFRHLSLMLVNDYEVIEYPGMRLIISNNPKLRGGKIFKKTVLVGMRYRLDSCYSYDFDKIQLGRDRDSINDPQQLKNLCSQLYSNILNNYSKLEENDKIIDQLPKILVQVVRMIKSCRIDIYHMHYTIQAHSADRIYRHYLKQKMVGELYPVNSSADQKTINEMRLKYGLPQSFYPSQFVSCHYNANLRSSTKYFQTINQKVQRQILDKNKRQMTDQQKDQFTPIKNAVAIMLPQINTFAFKIQQIQNIACYQDGNNIYINKHEMSNREVFKRKIIKLLVKDV